MSRYYVVGATQKAGFRKPKEWSLYDEAIIAEVDVESGNVGIRVRYRSPAAHCPDEDASFIFKAGTLAGDTLYVCTLTEVLRYRVPEFTELGCISLPCFNDLHHVAPCDSGNLLVANTGLDMVLEMTPEGETVREWSALEADVWERFSRDVDYRKVLTTKPHHAHPNFAFRLGEDTWTTRFFQRDAVCLDDMTRRIDLGSHDADSPRERPGGPHDGVRLGDRLYFTRVDGFVFVADAHTLDVVDVIDLNRIATREGPLGWCRGILPVDTDHAIVGFTVIRPTKHRQNLQWLRSMVKGGAPSPARISLYDLSRRELVWECPVQEAGVNAIFSIHPAP
jgi:hypothetical protein